VEEGGARLPPPLPKPPGGADAPSVDQATAPVGATVATAVPQLLNLAVLVAVTPLADSVDTYAIGRCEPAEMSRCPVPSGAPLGDGTVPRIRVAPAVLIDVVEVASSGVWVT
jgi:hypothetical protein